MASNDVEKIHAQLLRLQYEMRKTYFCATTGVSLWQPPVNLLKGGENLVVCMDISGLNKNEIRVRAENRRLLISGFRKFPEPKELMPEEGWTIYSMEIDHGHFERIIDLPEEIEPEKVKAEYRDGMLWVIMPIFKRG